MNKRGFLLSSIVALSISVSAQKIVVSKGQKLETVTSSKINMKMEMLGQNMEMEHGITGEVEVKNITDTGFIFQNTIKRITFKSNAMGQDMSFDSDKKEDMEGQIGQAMGDQIGKAQEITVNKQGKITGMEDDGNSAKGMTEAFNFANQLSKGQPYPLLIQLPAKLPKKGDSWTDSTGSSESMKSVYTYTLKESTPSATTVAFTGVLKTKGTIQQQGMEMELDLTGNISGEAIYEKATGLLKNHTAVTDMKGNIGVMGQSMPLSMTSNTNMEVKKL